MLALAALLTDLAITSTVLLGSAGILVRCLRRSSAASRHIVWTSALTALLLLPVGTGALPTLPVRVLAPTPSATQLAPPFAAAADAVLHDGGRGQRMALRTWARLERRPWHPAGMLGAVWLAGVVVLFGRAAAGKVRVGHLARQSDSVPGARLLHCATVIASRLGIRRSVVLLVARRDVMPATWGIMRPTVLLPSSSLSWSDERLETVLVHELAHVARFDAFTTEVARLASTLAWFNPLVWLSARQVRLEAEMACDDIALGHVERGSQYAAHLLALFETMAPLNSADALAMARRSRLERRLDAILAVSADRRGVSRGSLALAVALIATSLPLAAARLAEQPATILHRTSVPTAANSGPGDEGARRVQVAKDATTEAAVVAPSVRKPVRVSVPAYVGMGDVASVNEAGQAAQMPSIPIVGRWVPRDPSRQQEFFAVGMADLPGSGTLAIRQEGNTLRMSRTDTDGSLAIRAAIGTVISAEEVLRIDGTEFTDTRGREEFHRSARWDGEKLVIRRWRSSADLGMTSLYDYVTTYSLEGSELRVESVGLNRVLLFLKRID